MIPLLNIICDIGGAITEAGYQTVAAIEGAKSAVESIAAASAQGKERAQLVLAAEKYEEAGLDVAKAEEFQAIAGEDSEMAAMESEESIAMKGEGEQAQLFGDEKAEDSKREEALAAFDEEVRC